MENETAGGFRGASPETSNIRLSSNIYLKASTRKLNIQLLFYNTVNHNHSLMRQWPDQVTRLERTPNADTISASTVSIDGFFSWGQKPINKPFFFSLFLKTIQSGYDKVLLGLVTGLCLSTSYKGRAEIFNSRLNTYIGFGSQTKK